MFMCSAFLRSAWEYWQKRANRRVALLQGRVFQYTIIVTYCVEVAFDIGCVMSAAFESNFIVHYTDVELEKCNFLQRNRSVKNIYSLYTEN